MQAIQGVYDNGNLKLEKQAPTKKANVIVIFPAGDADDIEDASMLKALQTRGKSIKSTKAEGSRYLLEPDTSKTPKLGRLNGLIKIPDDFDDPLEEIHVGNRN